MRTYARLRNAVWEYRLNIRSWGASDDLIAPDGKRYVALPYRAAWAILNSLNLGPGDVFVDIGCGKGRVVCCAARFPIRQAIGIEFSAPLCGHARENARRLRGRQAPISIVNAPAQGADFSEGTIFYLYNPFGPATLDQVLQRIQAAWSARPRPLRLVYVHPKHESVLRDCGWLEAYDAWPPRRDLAMRHGVSFWKCGSGKHGDRAA